MKTIVALAMGVVAVSLASGCMSAAETAHRYAISDLQCPSARIRTEEIAPGAYMAHGCGRRTYYINNNAPSHVQIHAPGEEYVTLAAATP